MFQEFMGFLLDNTANRTGSVVTPVGSQQQKNNGWNDRLCGREGFSVLTFGANLLLLGAVL
jgi:hypothetical protein